MIDSLDSWSRRFARPDNWFAYYEKLAHLVPIARRALELVVYALVATLVVQQIEAIADLAGWGRRLIEVIGVVFVARVVVELVNLLIDEFMLKRPELSPEQKKRRATVVPLLGSGAKYLVYFGAGIASLEVLGIDSTVVLGAAGIFSLAVGLASQELIGDIVSGFFILFEDDFMVGDFVEMGGATGVVEEIDLRATCVRDLDGRLHILRNGQIDSVVNYSRKYVHAVVEVGVAYESDLRAVFAAFEEAGRRLAERCDQTLAPLEVQGLQAFGESQLTMRAVVRAQPGMHLEVQFALRRILWEVLEEHGVEVPYTRRVVIFKPESADDPEGEGAPPSGAGPSGAPVVGLPQAGA